MRTTAEIDQELLTVGQELSYLDVRQGTLRQQQRSLWAERERVGAVEQFVRLAQVDRDAFAAAVEARDLAELEAQVAAEQLEAAAQGNEEPAPGVVDGEPEPV